MLKKSLLGIVALTLVVAAAPVMAQGGSYRHAGGENQLRFRVGNFEPDAQSSYWNDTFFDFTGSPSSFEDTVGGIDFVRWVGPRLGVMLSGNGYSSEAVQAYRDFEDQAGRDIRHTTTFEVASATVGLIYRFGGRDAPLRPYVGAGGGFYDWSLEESGDVIDFAGGDIIFSDTFLTDGTAFGTYFLAGLDIPLGETWSVFAEGRWDAAEDDLAGDFEGLGVIDLAGNQIAAGFAWRF